MDIQTRVTLLVEQIEENLYSRKRVKELSALSHISDFHLQRVFKSMFGIPVGQYIRGRALSSSLDLLLNTRMRVIDIAAEYGFDYEQTYIRAFKKQFKVTPGEYRSNPSSLPAMPPFQLSDRSRMKNIALYGSDAEKLKVLGHVDDRANFFLQVIGDAKHMEVHDNGRYTWIHPRNGHRGANSVFNIRLDPLSDEDLKHTVDEIKALKRHTWWNHYSDRVNNVIFPEGRPFPTENDWEVYAIMFPDEKPAYRRGTANIQPVASLAEFKTWADVINRIEGNEIFHWIHHYPLCTAGRMRCSVAYDQGDPAAIAAMLRNGDAYSLEFVATLPAYRRKGFAAALCQASIDEAFRDGARFVTFRAYRDSKKFGETLGFKFI